MAALKLLSGRRALRGDEGSELIELAFVLPILLLVIAGIVDFGFLFQRYEALTNSAREGARVAVLPNYSVADVQARVQSYLAASGLSGAPAPVVTYQSQTLPGGQIVQTVTVAVSYPSSFLFLTPIAALVGGGAHGAVTLRAVSVMRMETAISGGS